MQARSGKTTSYGITVFSGTPIQSLLTIFLRKTAKLVTIFLEKAAKLSENCSLQYFAIFSPNSTETTTLVLLPRNEETDKQQCCRPIIFYLART